MISLASVRAGAKIIAQNSPEPSGKGVNLLLTDPIDYTTAVRQALRVFSQDKPNARVVDVLVTTAGFQLVLRGSGADAAFSGNNAWPVSGIPSNVWYPYRSTEQGNDPVDQNEYRILNGPDGSTILDFQTIQLSVGQTVRVEFARAHALTEAPNTVTAPAVAPAAALVTPAAAGNVDNGNHKYAVTFVTANGETTGSLASGTVTVANKASNGQVLLTGVPLSADTGVIARRIYRTTAADQSVLRLVGVLLDNVTVKFTDNVADADLGAVLPTTNTAAGANTVEDDDEDMLHLLGASFVLQMAANKAAQNVGSSSLPNDIVDRRSQSDIFRSRAKDLRDQYASLVGRGESGTSKGASAFGDLDTSFSDGRGFLMHRNR